MLGLYPSIAMYVFRKTKAKKMNVNYEYSRTLAAEGAILLLLGMVPYVGWILGIIGVVLFLKGMKELSNYYQDEKIYQHSWTGVKYYIVALIAAGVAVTALVIGVASATGFTFTGDFLFTAGFGVGLAAFLGGIVTAFVFYILATFHLKRTFDTLAEKTGETSLTTAGTLLWIGAILTIVVVGLLLILIGWIFATIGLFSMRPRQQQQYNGQQNGYTPPPTQPEQGNVKENRGMNNNSSPVGTLGRRGV
jgi:uncharacterized membrane protein